MQVAQKLPFFPPNNPLFTAVIGAFAGITLMYLVYALTSWFLNVRKANRLLKALPKAPTNPVQTGAAGQPGGAAQVGAVGQSGVASQKVYGLDDLRRDLTDATVSIDQIMAWCGHLDPAEIEKVIKELDPSDRKVQRMAWYSTMLKSNKALKVVPPPAPGKPVIMLKGSTELCKFCMPIGGGPSDDFRRRSCTMCHGRGYMIIERG